MKNRLIPPGKNLGFSDIFVDYLSGKKSASDYFLSPDIKTVVGSLDSKVFPREKLYEILMEQNRTFNLSDLTLKNIEKIKDPRSVCIFSGQQACLFGGPLLVVFKALAITKAAKMYEQQLCRPVIPVFWIAGDDHDFEEINHTYILDRNSETIKVTYESQPPLELSASEIYFENEVFLHQAKQNLKNALSETDFTPELFDLLERSYTSDDTFVTAFGKFMSGLTRNLGTVFFNPGDAEVKTLAKPFFKQIIKEQNKLRELISLTNEHILSNGYHVQVEKKENAAYLFYNCEGRQPIHFESNRFKVGDRLFDKDEILECLENHPERFSPDVMTRPVMQSYLFPVISQKGGPSELAYLAQINPIFKLFDTIPPFHKSRATATLLEKRFEKMMEEFEISFNDLTGDIEQVVNRVMEKSFPKNLEEKFNSLRQSVRDQFNDFTDKSLKFDPSLNGVAEQIMGKIDFNFNAFENKVFSAHKKKMQQTREKIYKLHNAVFTNRSLQERTVNITYFLARYGLGFVDKIYDAIDSEEKAHQIIKLSEMDI